ncbi:Solute carrier family 28 member 3 [Liparis tanakae]|uniref:Solute carrier family 28 member 3 n=1 Tax=Liparis tanakae TaxID=230148 RepID=A0A4Z2IRZ6_9TELE|nr:Solute carrier family 28 member 3 [Liparis tanakae]
MSIPASLAMAKIFWPETETPRVTASNILQISHGDSKNVFEAASQGASLAAGAVAHIVANLIAFLSLLAFIDGVLSWLGGMLDCPQLSFSLICSYVFMPLSFMMGVSWQDSFIVAELIGLKTFINEFIAYQKLSEFIKRRKAGGPEYVGNVHSETIATYALCGFSNFASMGLAIGLLCKYHRSDDLGCMLYIPDLQCPQFLSTEFINVNVTSSLQLPLLQLLEYFLIDGRDGHNTAHVHQLFLTPPHPGVQLTSPGWVTLQSRLSRHREAQQARQNLIRQLHVQRKIVKVFVRKVLDCHVAIRALLLNREVRILVFGTMVTMTLD